jgi:hypothetical protein
VRLEASAKRERESHPSKEQGLRINSISHEVQVLSRTLLRNSEGAAVVVALRNNSSHTLRNVGIGITVTNSAGRELYANNVPGIEEALTHVSVFPPHQRITWVDDQIPSGGAPSEVNVKVQDPPPARVPIPKITFTGVRMNEEGGSAGAAGTVHNESPITQHKLIVYGVARHGGRIVGAGRAILAEVPAHGSAPFQVFFVGSTAGAQVEVTAPPTTF